LSQSAVSSVWSILSCQCWAWKPATPLLIFEATIVILSSGLVTLLNFRRSCMILHQSANLVCFPVKILGSPMSRALEFLFLGLTTACSVFCLCVGSVICNLSSLSASSSSDSCCLGSVSLGLVSCLVLVLVSVSNVSGSLCLVNGRLVRSLQVLICWLIDSGPD
jgi:hypothetical protein